MHGRRRLPRRPVMVPPVTSRETEMGIAPTALERVKEKLIALASRTELFPEDSFPVPEGMPGKAYRLAEDADHRFALYAAAGAPGFSVAASLCALGAFLAGAVLGGRMVHKISPQRSLLLVVMVMALGAGNFFLVRRIETAPADLLARLQSTPAEGGRRRRRED